MVLTFPGRKKRQVVALKNAIVDLTKRRAGLKYFFHPEKGMQLILGRRNRG